MFNQAILKIETEMNQSKNNSYIQAVGSFLLQYLKVNPEAAEKILAADKSIVKSLDAMRQAASQKKVNNCAVLADQEGFTIVLKYFGINSTATATATATVAIEQSKENPVIERKASVDFDISLKDLLK
jgi:hypothetical protein